MLTALSERWLYHYYVTIKHRSRVKGCSTTHTLAVVACMQQIHTCMKLSCNDADMYKHALQVLKIIWKMLPTRVLRVIINEYHRKQARHKTLTVMKLLDTNYNSSQTDENRFFPYILPTFFLFLSLSLFSFSFFINFTPAAHL